MKTRWGMTRRLVRVAGVTLAFGYVAQAVLLFTLQDTLVFPGGGTRGRATASPGRGAELIHVPTRTGDTVALLFASALMADGAPDAKASTRPTLMYFYGNGTCLKTCDSQVEQLRRYGVNVLAAEYVGYGMSTGKPSEAGCYATADAAYDYLLTRPDVDPRRIVSAGGSLGGAVAIDLAARRPVAGLVTFMTFTCICDVAQGHFPWIPIAPLMRAKFDSIKKIKRVKCPILLVHGTQDRMIPYHMQAKLASAASTSVTQVVIKDATHNDLFDQGEKKIAAAFRKFLSELPTTAGKQQSVRQVTGG